ncbi:prolyl oligopeptidase family serine peptidase [Olivibacter sp. SDN3]|uniref:S9 family peptidase n=1 Tax=Olivibacter sp. SDN3 TaxID=2764720 RepID=UPI00165118C4|nr:prolyl oligopeptidase family serine peptidase [Olivibacter sp. SDN3]QNL48327.1 prolyl oligopeptidase family serine peptidase [Olivibacter sp. SDN3]
MSSNNLVLVRLLLFCLLMKGASMQAQHFELKSIYSFPFPTGLTSAATGSKIAFALNEEGKRNIYVSDDENFTPIKLTNYSSDDGQEISSLSVSDDGEWVVYVRGGDHGGSGGAAVNSLSLPVAPKVEIFSLPFEGGEPQRIGEGDYPIISPMNDRVAFLRNGQVWVAPIDASSPAERLFAIRGNVQSFSWSPSGDQVAFSCLRDDHAFLGVFSHLDQPIVWLSPAFAWDSNPVWSPDGSEIAFVRTPGKGGAPDSLLARKHQPWEIWVASSVTGEGMRVWKAPETLAGSLPTTQGGANLQWGLESHLNFVSYHDGWPHIYALPLKPQGQPILLTPGDFMVEHVTLSPDKKTLVFSANTGSDSLDLHRRHIGRVAVDKPGMELLTDGKGMETYPQITGDGKALLMLKATAEQPLLPAVKMLEEGGASDIKILGEDLLPADLPLNQLVTPKAVTFEAEDGMLVHAQLYEPVNSTGDHPAIVYIHGGPQRQMLLGWHYMDYYAYNYALNQYLVNQGFTVLSVNYRLGIGYGYEAHKPAHGGMYGAAEYKDIKAAGAWLARQAGIDKNKIGVYGGSYGGYLTAMALARDSEIFAAGVDIHGVHNFMGRLSTTDAELAPDTEEALRAVQKSSPVTWLDQWKSPVLIIHADDDRNVSFHQSVDLVRRFEQKGIPYSYLVIPDDTHHWMRHANALKVAEATADFLTEQLMHKNVNNSLSL